MFSVLLYDYLSTHSTNEQQLGVLFKIFLSQVLFILPFEIARPKYLKIIAEHGINIPKISLGRNPLFFQEGVSEKVRWMESGKAARAVLVSYTIAVLLVAMLPLRSSITHLSNLKIYYETKNKFFFKMSCFFPVWI